MRIGDVVGVLLPQFFDLHHAGVHVFRRVGVTIHKPNETQGGLQELPQLGDVLPERCAGNISRNQLGLVVVPIPPFPSIRDGELTGNAT